MWVIPSEKYYIGKINRDEYDNLSYNSSKYNENSGFI